MLSTKRVYVVFRQEDERHVHREEAMRLRRKVALITGAASGIGQGVADLTGFGNLSGLMNR